MKRIIRKFYYLLSIVFLLTTLAAMSACGPKATPTSTPTATPTVTSSPTTTASPTPTTTPTSVTIDLVAQNMAFNKSTITVPAGTSVTMNFNNKDSVPHNFALYTNSSAATMIFRGQTIINDTIVYTFTAPSTPGTYFFRCDVHPTSMTGTFVVE